MPAHPTLMQRPQGYNHIDPRLWWRRLLAAWRVVKWSHCHDGDATTHYMKCMVNIHHQGYNHAQERVMHEDDGIRCIENKNIPTKNQQK